MAHQARDRGSLVSAPPDQAPQSQAHLYYFLAPTKRTYGDGTNLRMSYCHFPTVFDCLRCAPARIALWEPAYFVLARRRKACLLATYPLLAPLAEAGAHKPLPSSLSRRRKACLLARSSRTAARQPGSARRSAIRGFHRPVMRAIARRSQPTSDVVTRREKPLSPAGRIVCTLVIKDDPQRRSEGVGSALVIRNDPLCSPHAHRPVRRWPPFGRLPTLAGHSRAQTFPVPIATADTGMSACWGGSFARL
jgi:hypothetical protein